MKDIIFLICDKNGVERLKEYGYTVIPPEEDNNDG